jgi:ureidoacrylate peracid hydrolase
VSFGAKIALLLCDLQNDFVHPRGAYGRAGKTSPEIAALPGRLAPLVNLVRAKDGWIVSTLFTLVPGKRGEPIISSHLKALRPFLARGDFQPGLWGHALVEELAPADLSIEKIAYSAFYMTRLEWVLRKAGVEMLYVAGLVTNGGVTSTVRDAHVRDLSPFVLSDGCADFSPALHEMAIAALRPIVPLLTVAEAMEDLRQ